MKHLCLLFAVFSIWACSKQQKQPTEPVHEKNGHTVSEPVSVPSQPLETSVPDTANSDINKPAFPESDPSAAYSFKIISSDGGTYGYEILNEGRPMIRQTSIPGLPGNAGFKTKEAAEKVAAKVIEKIKQGEMPPTISPAEMEKMNVL